MNVYRLVCRPCNVVFLSTTDFEPVKGLTCFCGNPLIEYVTRDHLLWERMPIEREALASLPRKEVKAQHAKARPHQNTSR